MSLLDPLSPALSHIVAGAHAVLTSIGSAPSSALTWLLSIAAVVVAVRLALLPLTAHSVRQAHAAARARPALRALSERYRHRTDTASLRALAEERRAIAVEHRMSRLGCLPLLLQLPVWLSLYHLLSQAAAGTPVGAMDAALVASLGAATVLGVPLAEGGYLGAGFTHVVVVAGLAITAAAVGFVTQRFVVAPNTVLDGLPEAMVSAHRMLPMVSALGLVLAGAFAPVALLVYWVTNATWTLGQAAVVTRWFPTPGSAAALAREARVNSR